MSTIFGYYDYPDALYLLVTDVNAGLTILVYPVPESSHSAVSQGAEWRAEDPFDSVRPSPGLQKALRHVVKSCATSSWVPLVRVYSVRLSVTPCGTLKLELQLNVFLRLIDDNFSLAIYIRLNFQMLSSYTN